MRTVRPNRALNESDTIIGLDPLDWIFIFIVWTVIQSFGGAYGLIGFLFCGCLGAILFIVRKKTGHRHIRNIFEFIVLMAIFSGVI